MFRAKQEPIPTARVEVRDAAGRLERAAAEAKQGVRVAGAIGSYAARGALMLAGLAAVFWFAAKGAQTHRTAGVDSERTRQILEENLRLLQQQWRYDLHRIHFDELKSHVEDLASVDSVR